MFNLLFLHIAFMFVAIAMHAGPQLLTLVAIRGGQLDAVAPITRVWLRGVPVVSAAFGLGALFGLATAFAFGFDLLSPWLVIAYVLFVASGMWSNFVTVPHFRRLASETAQLATARALGADVARVEFGRSAAIVTMDLMFIAALVYDMAVKPLG